MFVNQIEEALKLAPAVPRNINAADKTPWIIIQHVPALGTGGAAATVSVATAAETITFQVDAADPAGLDTIGNTSGEISLVGTTDTMGELADIINGTKAWRAYLGACLRSDVPSHLLNFSAKTCFGDNGATLYSDTTDSLEIGIVISGEKFVNNGISGHKTDFDDQCINQVLYGATKLGDGTGVITMSMYTGKQGETEVLLGGADTLTEDTQELIGDASGDLPFKSATTGSRLIIRAVTDSAFDAYTEFNFVGKTAVLANDRQVKEANYSV